MAFEKPTLQQVRETADSLGFRLSEGELHEYFALMQDSFAAYEAVDGVTGATMPRPVPPGGTAFVPGSPRDRPAAVAAGHVSCPGAATGGIGW